MRVSREQRQRFWVAIRAGMWTLDAAVVAGVSRSTGEQIVREFGGVMEPLSVPTGRYLSLAEREEIAILHAQGVGVRDIGRRIGRPHCTVSRELARNSNRPKARRRAVGAVGAVGGRGVYRASAAHQRAQQRARRPKQGKLAANPRLLAWVATKLEKEQWSPEQISHALRVEFPDDESMRCHHETIYRSLYVQSRGELRRELTRHLRTRRSVRKPQHRPERRKGRLVDPISISERPAEVADRAVPGHWEGDLILGKAGGSAIGTLVERASRFVVLVHLPKRRTAVDFAEALIPALRDLPEQLRGSLTWDQGKEMALHKQIALEAGMDLYFCDPRSPWQRGSNENTNGLLRQYFPREANLRQFSPADLAEVAAKLNRRPRKTLDWATPGQRLEELLCGHKISRGATTG